MKKIYLLTVLFSMTMSAQLEWRALTTIPANGAFGRFDDVFFLNDNLGWAANGSAAAVYKTTDGGATWNEQLSEIALGGNYYFRNIEFLNENIGFLGTLNNVFFKTTDGGITWNPVTNISPSPAAICGIDCVGNSTVYGCGAYFTTSAYIIKSVDSGETWQYIDMGAYASALVELLFTDENNGYASGSDATGGIILKTSDGGATWTKIYSTEIPGEYVWKLQILQSSPNVMFGSVESVSPMNGKLIKSADTGVTWVSREVPDTDIQAVGFLTENHGWMGGHHTGFLETFDAGATWNDTGLGSNLNRITILHDDLAYCSGATVYKFSDTNLSDVKFTEKFRTPLKAAVTPNPVKDKLTVTVAFLENDHLKIELYDDSGHRLRELLQNNISGPSTKTYSFDFPYPAGVYLINLHTNTGRQSIKFVK